MFAFFKRSRRLVLTAGLIVLPAAAFAQVAPRITVPEPPGNPGHTAGFQGCYAINQDLYGPYRMTFCLDRNGNGSYRVVGAGLNCIGWLGWRERWNGEAQINLQYSSCGRGVGWSADTMVCTVQHSQWPPFQQPWGGGGGWMWQGGQQPQPGARIAVPEPSNSLRCTYQPAIRGYQPISVLADRTW